MKRIVIIMTVTAVLITDNVSAQNVGIGTNSPGEKLEVKGKIYSNTGGFKFPDGTVQETAAEATDITTLVDGLSSSYPPYGATTRGNIWLEEIPGGFPLGRSDAYWLIATHSF